MGVSVSKAAPDGVATPPEKLGQHISAAKRSGLKDNIVRRDAVTGGWRAELVDRQFDYDAVFEGEMEPNIQLLAGDTIVILH
jgi:hypothetical protein